MQRLRVRNKPSMLKWLKKRQGKDAENEVSNGRAGTVVIVVLSSEG